MKKLFIKLTKHYLKTANELKEKPSKLKYYYSEILYFITIILSKIIRKSEIKKLDVEKIKNYYNLYGEEDTLKHFGLSKEVLSEIVSS